jgi:hypothetical protein
MTCLYGVFGNHNIPEGRRDHTTLAEALRLHGLD